jgi:hypothetical protein
MHLQQPIKLPFLEFIGWQIADVYQLSQPEMLANYERGWRYKNLASPPVSELAFIKQLVFTYNSWLSSEFMEFQIGHHQLDGVDLLAIDLDLPKTPRTISESGDEIFPFLQ